MGHLWGKIKREDIIPGLTGEGGRKLMAFQFKA